MSICYLVGAGDFYGKLDIGDTDVIIAADGGYNSLRARGYVPNVLIGDFDSIVGELPEGIRTLRHPKEKDQTDMFLAYEEGVRLGYTEFVMLGATGGRLDHTYANIALLLYAKERGHNVTVIDEAGFMLCIKNESVTLSGDPGDYFSVFAIGGKAEGVCVEGAKYEAKDVTLTPDFPLGVSNEFTDRPVIISVMDGALLIISK